ncbi:16S rRNA (uracil(1498)-N(3))-methyltransferase [Thermaurantiacus sp.]
MRQIPRLFVAEALAEGRRFPLPPGQTHQLATVLRLAPGAELRLLDDRTGEWAARIVEAGRRAVTVEVGALIRARETVPDCWLVAAPIRRFAFTVEKATELGIARVVPLLTERTQHHRQSRARLVAHMVEAAEQCGRTALPELAEPVRLPALLAGWDPARTLLFADEEGGAPMPTVPPPVALLIGPEGGFAAAERARLRANPSCRPVSLGPHLLRAETAAVVAIAQWQRLALGSSPV